MQNLTVKVQRLSRTSVDFDIVGVDASIANAFRRIMIAEVCPPISPTFFGAYVYVILSMSVLGTDCVY